MIWLRLALAAILTGIGLVGAGIWWLQENLAPAALAAEPVLFEVAPGASLKRIARGLEAAGLVRDARAVELLARHRKLGSALQAGEYRLSAASPPDAILSTIAQGRVATYELVVPEGFTAVMIAERLADANLGDAGEFLAWVQNPASAAAHGVEGTSLEGYLFPDTYHLPRGLDARATAAVFVNRFEEVWSEIAARAKERGLSKREVVTLASIVEKETGAPQERPLIAAVFLNRMKRGMRLETDPTVIYGISDFDGNLRRRDLENRENPYNTYVIPGLPPGPIASPGRDALLAVVEPAKSEFLFFVSRNDGTHRFSRTYAEHELAVNEFQREAAFAMTDATPDPHSYYTQAIPTQFNRMLEAQSEQGEAGRGVHEDMLAVNESIHVEILGDDSQHFYLNIEAGRMTPGDTPDHDAFVHLSLDTNSFEQLAREAGESLTGLLGALAGLGGEMKLTRKRVRDLKMVAGLIRFEVTGEAGFTLLTAFGSDPGASEPDAVIRMSETSYRELRAGKLDPQTAFLDDAIHAEGNMQKVMQLAFAAVAPD